MEGSEDEEKSMPTKTNLGTPSAISFENWARFEGYADCENCGGHDVGDGAPTWAIAAGVEGAFCEDCGDEVVPMFGPEVDEE